MKHFFILLSVSLLSFSAFGAKITSKEITYKVGDQSFKGFVAKPKKIEGTTPGVIVVHEWWGHNDYARMRAKKLAELGFVALAIDMYGDGKTATHPKDAGKFSGMVFKDLKSAEARFKRAIEVLKEQEGVAKDRIASIGYCFGGGLSIEMARRGVDIKAVASFHGSLSTQNPAQKGKVKAKILVLNGEADPLVSADSVKDFKSEMKSAGVDMKYVGYEKAKHAFTNPGATKLGKKFKIPLAYDKEADTASWEEMKSFFKMNL